MNSVIVRGMEMPQNCDKCRFQSALRLYCDAMPYNFCGNTDDIERPDWCPLIEISTPHGRLIDGDAYIKMMEEKCDHESSLDEWVLKVCRGGVSIMPTVIEAEG